MSKFYGNLTNRLEEGKNFTGREIKAGDDITMYLWSDRRCYYVTEVIDQKHIKVKPYFVCADKDKADGMGHQEWKYFTHLRDMHDYINFDDYRWSDEEYAKAESEDVWVFRYGKWMRELYITEMRHPDAYSKREREQFAKHGFCKTYANLSGSVSFGRRDYYYDWEF